MNIRIDFDEIFSHIPCFVFFKIANNSLPHTGDREGRPYRLSPSHALSLSYPPSFHSVGSSSFRTLLPNSSFNACAISCLRFSLNSKSDFTSFFADL